MVDLRTAARVLGIGRTTAYALARADEFPCPVFRVGGAYKVPTVGLLRLLGIDAVSPPAESPSKSVGVALPETGPQREHESHGRCVSQLVGGGLTWPLVRFIGGVTAAMTGAPA